jgi:uncharacterized protein involved in outer membrane biogenesis
MKKIIIILGVVLVLAIVALVVVGAFLDRIVKAGVESVAPGITQTTVTLEGVSLSPLSGSASLKGLVVGNPQGYTAPQAIRLGMAAVKLQPSSLLGDKVILHSIEIREPEITFAGNPLGDNNLKKILDNVQAKASADASATNAPGAKGAGKKLQVDDFLISGAKVHAQIRTPILTKEISITLPDIHLTNLGQGPEGITPAELTQQVMSQITASTIKSLGDSVSGLGKDLLEDVKKNPADAVKKITKGIDGLFKK